MLLSRCRPETAVAWSRRGLGRVTVASLDGWTIVMPTGPARARYPYDDAVASFAGRPVGLWMRPALGFVQLGRQAAVTVHPAAWRAVQRWAIWTVRDGLVPPIGLPAARPADLIAAAGLGDDADSAGSLDRLDESAQAALAERLRATLRDGDGDALGVLRTVLDTLSLPGIDLLTGETQIGQLPGARVVDPAPRHARAFDRIVAEEARHRIELEA